MTSSARNAHDSRKRATIRYFLDAVDREVYLSPNQRERLEKSFNSHWEPTWTLYLDNHLYGNRYYPMTVDAHVVPLLTDAQKKVWAGVQKVGAYWGFAGVLGGFTNDPDGLEIELGQPARKDQDRNAMIGIMKMQPGIQPPGGAIIIHEIGPDIEVQGKVVGVRKGGPKQIRPPAKKGEKAKD